MSCRRNIAVTQHSQHMTNEIDRVPSITNNVNEMYSKISGLNGANINKSIDPNGAQVTCKMGSN